MVFIATNPPILPRSKKKSEFPDFEPCKMRWPLTILNNALYTFTVPDFGAFDLGTLPDIGVPLFYLAQLRSGGSQRPDITTHRSSSPRIIAHIKMLGLC